jgi:hypothetical protein
MRLHLPKDIPPWQVMSSCGPDKNTSRDEKFGPQHQVVRVVGDRGEAVTECLSPEISGPLGDLLKNRYVGLKESEERTCSIGGRGERSRMYRHRGSRQGETVGGGKEEACVAVSDGIELSVYVSHLLYCMVMHPKGLNGGHPSFSCSFSAMLLINAIEQGRVCVVLVCGAGSSRRAASP